MRVFRIFAFLAVLVLASGCKKHSGINQSLFQIWLSSDEVTKRIKPAIFSSQRADGSWVAIATGDFVEIDDGIDLHSNDVLPSGFYVFPGRIRVNTLEEAVTILESSAGRKYKAESGHSDS